MVVAFDYLVGSMGLSSKFEIYHPKASHIPPILLPTLGGNKTLWTENEDGRFESD